MKDCVSTLATCVGSVLNTPALRNLAGTEPELFHVINPGDIAKWPAQLKNWLNLHISLICPPIDELAPAMGQHCARRPFRPPPSRQLSANPLTRTGPRPRGDIELEVHDDNGRHELRSYPQHSESHFPLQGLACESTVTGLLGLLKPSQEPWGGTVG